MKTINSMLKAIEHKHTILKLHRCQAGWGMVFIKPHEQPRFKYKSGDRAKAYQKWWNSHIKLSEEHSVVYHYYPTLEACVKNEYKQRVLLKRGLPDS